MCNANKCAIKLMSTTNKCTTNSHATLLKAQQKQTGNAKKTRIANYRATQTSVHASKCPTQRKQTHGRKKQTNKQLEQTGKVNKQIMPTMQKSTQCKWTSNANKH